MHQNPRTSWGAFGRPPTKGRVSGGAPGRGMPDWANNKLWMDVVDIDGLGNSTLGNGVALASWVNKGSLGGVLAQATPANQPTYRATAGPGGRPSAEFAGAQWLLSSLPASAWSFLHDGSGATIYTVFKTSAVANKALVATMNGLTATRGVFHSLNTGNRVEYLMSDGSAFRLYPTSSSIYTISQHNVYASAMASANTPDLSGSLNGGTAVGLSGSASAFSMADPETSLCVGGTANGGSFGYTGLLAPVLIFAAAHDATMQAAVVAWLATDAAIAGYPL